MDLAQWLTLQGGVAHREHATAEGFGLTTQRQAIEQGMLHPVRRHWIAVNSADAQLRLAATNTARIACVSAARRREWWIPEALDARLHLAVLPHGASPRIDKKKTVVHWSRQVAPAPAWSLVESTEDALAHIAVCAEPIDALVMWESAIRKENLAVDALRRVRWPSAAAQARADEVTGLSDSGLETIVITRLSPWGHRLRQQAVIAGQRVDLLIGERLVVQIDGFAHHSKSAQRTKDVALDAELRLRGYTVLRFTYAQVLHDWRGVERTIARAIAAGAHLDP